MQPTQLKNTALAADMQRLAMLRNLATPGDWQPRLDGSGDAIGIEVRELLWNGPVTPEMADKGIDQQIVGEEVVIVANMAWDEAGNELERIDANINYVCELHRFGTELPRLLARLDKAEAAATELPKVQEYVRALLNDLLNDPELPASIHSVLWRHRQQLTVKA